jgi:Fe-S cluster assembly scaffold protein SufB
MPRNLIVAGRNSQASVAEVYLTKDDSGASFANIVTEIVVLDNANLEHIKIQNEGKSGIQYRHYPGISGQRQ